MKLFGININLGISRSSTFERFLGDTDKGVNYENLIEEARKNRPKGVITLMYYDDPPRIESIYDPDQLKERDIEEWLANNGIRLKSSLDS